MWGKKGKNILKKKNSEKRWVEMLWMTSDTLQSTSHFIEFLEVFLSDKIDRSSHFSMMTLEVRFSVVKVTLFSCKQPEAEEQFLAATVVVFVASWGETETDKRKADETRELGKRFQRFQAVNKTLRHNPPASPEANRGSHVHVYSTVPNRSWVIV